MANGPVVAKAFVELIPSMQGSQAIITKELTGASGAAGDAAGKEMGKTMSSGLSSSMKSTGKVIAGVTAGIIGGVAAVGTAIMESFKEVDAGLDTIRTKTGASGTELENMKTSMENLATSIPTSFENAGEAIGEVSTRFGVTGAELETLSGQFLKFAKINNTDITSSVDNVQKALSAFGLGTEDAGNMLDVLNKVGQDTGVNIDTLTKGLIQNGTAFQEMGLSAEQAVVFMGQMEKSGANSETVMQGLRKALKNATADGTSMKDALAQLQDKILNGTEGVDGLSAAYDLFGKSGDQIYSAIKNGTLDFEALGDAALDAAGSVNSTFEEVTDPTDEFAEAMNRIKIVGADIGEAMMPLLADALEGITGVIAGIIDAVTPAETVLSRFIKDTNESIDANRAAIEAASSMVDDALGNVAEIDFYKGVIMDLNDKTTLTELEQYQLKDAVDKLSDSVPGLANAWDETNGTLKLSNSELEKLFDNAQKLALQSAMLEIQTETTKALARAKVDEARAQQGAEKALEEYNATAEQTYSGANELSNALGQSAWSDQEAAVMGAAHAYEEAKKATEEAQQAAEELPDALRTAAIEMGASEEEADLMAQGLYGVSTAAEEVSEDVAEVSEVSEQDLKAAEEAAQKLEEEFNSLRDSIQQSVSNSITYLGEFTHAAETNATEMANNLTASNDYIAEWISNMDTLGQAMEGMSGKEKEAFQALYDDMLEKGPQTAGEAAKAMAAALSDPNNKGEFDRAVDEYSRSLDLTSDSAKLAQYSSTGKAFTGEMAKGIESSASEVTNAAGQVASDATDKIDAEVDTGMNQVNNTWDSQLSSMQSTTNTTMNNIRTSVNDMITDITKALDKEIKGPNIKVPHFTMTGEFDAKTGKVPTVDVKWYGKGAIFTQPTIIGTPYGWKGVGESGAEAVLPIERLKNYIEDVAPRSITVNVAMEVNGAENPDVWAVNFARTLKQQMRIS